jgi:hypothetical protein
MFAAVGVVADLVLGLEVLALGETGTFSLLAAHVWLSRYHTRDVLASCRYVTDHFFTVYDLLLN